jgi:hypothetical protein
MEVNSGRQVLTQESNPFSQSLAIISVEWRSAYPLRQPHKRHAPDLKAVILY